MSLRNKPPDKMKRGRITPAQWMRIGRHKEAAMRRRVVARRRGGARGRGRFATTELKFHDVDLDNAAVAGAGAVTASINLIAQGVTESTRVGRKCVLTSVSWRYEVVLPEFDAQATPSTGDILRIILFVDKQANGATAAVVDILETADFQSFNNLTNSGRFRTLMDKTIALSYQAMGSDGAGVISGSQVLRQGVFFKQINLPLEFSAGAGVITEIRSNNLGVLLISKSGAMGFASKFRLRFSDG